METKRFKVHVAGEGYVGRTALIRQFCCNAYVEIYDPTGRVGDELFHKYCNVDGGPVIFEFLFNAVGQMDMWVSPEETIPKMDAFMFVYDVTQPATLQALQKHFDEVRKYARTSPVPMVMVGNKADLKGKQVVRASEGEAVAKAFGARFFECSAMTRENVEEAFMDLWTQYQRQNPEEKSDKSGCQLQ